MSGIVLEGGTFRPIFSCGIMDCLNDHDIMFDYCIGVSQESLMVFLMYQNSLEEILRY